MKDHFKDLVVRHEQPVVDAIAVIEHGPTQIALVVDDMNVLVGVLTNGDIRRFLMQGGHTTAPVHGCMNRKFHALPFGTSREELLKLFDLGYNAVPLLDPEGRLVEFATPDFFPPNKEVAVLSRARAPVRISFSGGGTDLTYYFMQNGGVVLNSSIALYAHATLIPSSSSEINIISHDIDRHEHYSSLRALLDSPDKGLLSSVVSVIRPDFGFDLYVHSDFPVGSGLGGSSAVATSVVGAFNELRLDKWSTYEIAELSFQAERLCFSISGGWQDQYASAFGGFNLIEFDGKRNMVHSLRLEDSIRNELEECLVLCNTGIKHDSGKIHVQQREDFHKSDRNQQLLDMVELCRKMHKHLIRGDLNEFGKSLHEAWVIKHGLSSAISGNTLDAIYNAALEAGALGGKLLGAGGGGFFLFYVQPRNRAAVCSQLKALGCTLSTVRFEQEGVTSWRTKAE
ncbi:CBS domain-containing protein [Paraburkholderia sp. J7]|uniref:GHMP family kinase ATP-binding protein n=1 Tax=Paraburkholderia sp. J7 TaxID=2805438 RepID=UPI002AB606D2|nr:CBS domain-containing protein [Paraburkholderia sp. J7]